MSAPSRADIIARQLRALVDAHGPRLAVDALLDLLDPGELRAFASVYVLAEARRLAAVRSRDRLAVYDEAEVDGDGQVSMPLAEAS
jgi:hypothetical protein